MDQKTCYYVVVRLCDIINLAHHKVPFSFIIEKVCCVVLFKKKKFGKWLIERNIIRHILLAFRSSHCLTLLMQKKHLNILFITRNIFIIVTANGETFRYDQVTMKKMV